MSLSPVAFWPGPILSDVNAGEGVVGACELPVMGKDLMVTTVGVSGDVVVVAVVVVVVMMVLFLTYNDAERMLILYENVLLQNCTK